MKVSDITKVIEDFAPLSIQEEWDNSGLCIGSANSEVHSVLIGFDCTPALVDEAIEIGADLIITHHPLLFIGIKKIDPSDPVSLALIKAVKAGINVYAAHTTADKVISGVSGEMARKLGLKDIEILEKDGLASGLGAVGNLPEPISSTEAVELVKKTFNLKMVRTSKPVEIPISRIAMCGGSGSSLIEEAKASGAQLYLSGDISYHHFFTPEGFMLMDVGHFESEVEIVSILFSLIKKKFPTFAVHICMNINNSNPIFYF